MIWKHENGEIREVPALLKLLLKQKKSGVSGPFVIAAAGAGGKTSLLWSLAREACRVGMKTVLGTTTHMLLPERLSVLDGDEKRAVKLLERDGFVCIGTPCPGWKGSAERDGQLPPGIKDSAVKCQKAPASLRSLLSSHADLILEEADGSRRLPAKYPRADEPVLSADTDVVLAVMGLSALGKAVGDAFHRYEMYPGGLAEKELIRPEHLAEALRSGYIDRVPALHSGGAVIPVLNQADTAERISQAGEILSLVSGEVPYGLITRLRPEACPDQ